MSGILYGYIRVSTKEQNEDRQKIAMQEYGVPKENVYMDKQSGKDFERPGYRELMEVLDEDDVFVIKSIDRLGRDFDEILEQWRIITKEKRAGIIVLDMPVLNTGLQKDLLGRVIAGDDAHTDVLYGGDRAGKYTSETSGGHRCRKAEGRQAGEASAGDTREICRSAHIMGRRDVFGYDGRKMSRRGQAYIHEMDKEWRCCVKG